MRNLSPDALVRFVADVMRAGGSNDNEAHTIARRLVDANLVGHDSHGVIRVGKYLEWVRSGWLVPNARATFIVETDALAIIDGNRGFGQVIGEIAAQRGVAKAKRGGIALIGLRNCGHLGRVGDWAELAADAGVVSLHFLNTSGAQRVAPFGGSDRRLSTNPISIGIPVAGSDPVIVDLTTSMVAEGKLMVAKNKGESVPEGWIIDAHGRPTTDPADFYDGGALLTVGGHKGSALSMAIDLLAGALTTGRSSDPDDTVLRNNMLSIYIAPQVYDKAGNVAQEVRRFVDWVKASPPINADAPVLAPGDIERMTRAKRSVEGVPIDDKTWSDLCAAAASVSVVVPDLAALEAGR